MRRFGEPSPDARHPQSRCSRVVRQPEDRCRRAIDRAILLGWDGVDRWGAITGAGDAARPQPLSIVHPSGRAVYQRDRDGEWKLIMPKKGPAELYDLAADPFEKHNRAAEQPAVVERLASIAAQDAAGDVTEVPADLRDLPP